MKILTALVAGTNKGVSINCDHIICIKEHEQRENCVVVTTTQQFVISTSYLDAVGYLKSDY